jgi:hypothetical protein
MPTFENIDLQGGLTFQVEPIPLGGSIHVPTSGLARYSTANGDFTLGTSDFTIEWFHKLTDVNRGGIFWGFLFVEFYPVSGQPDSAQVFVRTDGAVFTNAIVTNAWNVWDYYAITRQNNVFRTFRNGIQIGTSTQTVNIGTSQFGWNLFSASSRGFAGFMTNFHWVNGTCLYTSNFTPPTAPILPVSNSKLLLRATNATNLLTDSSGLNKVPFATSGTIFSEDTPFSP